MCKVITASGEVVDGGTAFEMCQNEEWYEGVLAYLKGNTLGLFDLHKNDAGEVILSSGWAAVNLSVMRPALAQLAGQALL